VLKVYVCFPTKVIVSLGYSVLLFTNTTKHTHSFQGYLFKKNFNILCEGTYDNYIFINSYQSDLTTRSY
jgi:hypothetical protein